MVTAIGRMDGRRPSPRAGRQSWTRVGTLFETAITSAIDEDVGDGPRIKDAEVAEAADEQDGCQGGWHRLGQLGQEVHDEHGRDNQTDHQSQLGALEPAYDGASVFRLAGQLLEEAELAHADDDGETIDEADHNGVGDQANEAPQFEGARKQLDKPAKIRVTKRYFSPISVPPWDSPRLTAPAATIAMAPVAGDHARTTAHGGSDEANKHGGQRPTMGLTPARRRQWLPHESQGHRKA